MHLEKLRFPKNRKKIQEAHVASADLEKRTKRASNSLTDDDCTVQYEWSFVATIHMDIDATYFPVTDAGAGHYDIEQSSVSFFPKIPRTSRTDARPPRPPRPLALGQ